MSRRIINKRPRPKNKATQAIDKDRLKFTLERRINRELGIGASVKFADELDLLSKDLIVSAHFFIDYHLMDEVVVRYPANWWQAVREAFSPNWLLDRWPIKYAETRMIAGLYDDRVNSLLRSRGYQTRVIVTDMEYSQDEAVA